MRKYNSLLFIIFCVLVVSCNKIENKFPLQNDLKVNIASLASVNAVSFFNAPFINYDNDSIERITVLGPQLTNPYLYQI